MLNFISLPVNNVIDKVKDGEGGLPPVASNGDQEVGCRNVRSGNLLEEIFI